MYIMYSTQYICGARKHSGCAQLHALKKTWCLHLCSAYAKAHSLCFQSLITNCLLTAAYTSAVLHFTVLLPVRAEDSSSAMESTCRARC
jgi:hypothetical protein